MMGQNDGPLNSSSAKFFMKIWAGVVAYVAGNNIDLNNIQSHFNNMQPKIIFILEKVSENKINFLAKIVIN